MSSQSFTEALNRRSVLRALDIDSSTSRRNLNPPFDTSLTRVVHRDLVPPLRLSKCQDFCRPITLTACK